MTILATLLALAAAFLTLMGAAPVMSFGTRGGALAQSTALAAAASVSFNLDLSGVFEGQLMIRVAMGGTVAGTAGVRVDIYELYENATPTYSGVNPNYSLTIPAGAASAVVYSPKIFLPTGKWRVTLTNLDATNALGSVEATLDQVTAVS